VNFLRPYLLAVRHFTRVPVSGALAQWMGPDADPAPASAAHYPGVGWLVGIVACAAFAIVGLLLPDVAFAPVVAAIASMAATLMLTGGAPENGLVRSADALARDPQVRTTGVLLLVMTVVAKAALLALLAGGSPAAVMAALLAAQVMSRFWPALLARGLRFIGERTHPMAQPVPPRGLAIAGAWCLPALGIAWLAGGPAFMLVGVGVSALALLWLRRLYERRLQGFDDDALGAMQQVGELAFYLGCAIGSRAG
jgi:adenosylcobinamide-GDP ribazoletransferase